VEIKASNVAQVFVHPGQDVGAVSPVGGNAVDPHPGVDDMGQGRKRAVHQQVRFAAFLQGAQQTLGLDQIAKPGQLNDQKPERRVGARRNIFAIHALSSGKMLKKSRTPRIFRPYRPEKSGGAVLDKRGLLC
jgi:hypothetical protein